MYPPTPTGPSRRFRLLPAALALVILATLARVGYRDEAAGPPVNATTTVPPSTTTSTTAAPTTTTTIPDDPVPPDSTVTATPMGRIPASDTPNGPMTRTIDDLYYGFPTSLPVIEQTDDGWLHVRLPYKPNGSTAWIRKDMATLGSTPWAIQIDVTTMRLKLFEAGRQMLDAPVGIGTASTPTAQGDFFVTFLQAAPHAGYGPFVMVTNGHSDVIQSWAGFPDGILGIHGPIGSDAAIGDTGARISNGCIRMHVADQLKLQAVGPGTPILIFASPPRPEPHEPPEQAEEAEQAARPEQAEPSAIPTGAQA